MLIQNSLQETQKMFRKKVNVNKLCVISLTHFNEFEIGIKF
jgi:hypothetical protein